jgi:rubrerythrin
MSKTEKNLKEAFAGEAKAYIRLIAFAEKAEKEGYKQIAKLFRAVAEAEKIHAKNHLNLLGIINSTEENLKYSFEREKFANEVAYPDFIKQAEEEGNKMAVVSFVRARDVEEGHKKLYKLALQHLMEEKETSYYLCKVCGYISDNILPEECPVCGAKKEMFEKIE